MQLLGPLAALLGIEVNVLVARARRNAIAYSAMALLVLIALTFLLVAGYLALSQQFGPIVSALIIAGVALVVTVIVGLWTSLARNARKRQILEKRRSTEATTLVTTAALAVLPMLIRNPTLRLIAIPVGAVIGYMLLSNRGDDHPDLDQRDKD